MGSSTSKHKTKAYKLHHSQPSGRPLPPGKPTLKYDPENLDPDTVTIKWDPPAFNGGSKITGYLVEHKRTGSPHWVKASPIKVCHTQLTVCGLEPGWRYQFRVTAENEFGLSDPSPLSEPLAIFVHRSAAIAPYFVTELNDLVVLENEKVEFTVTFEGIPLPKISWYKDGMEMFSNRCQKISTEGCASSLLIYEATISDEAEIKCSATNRVGYAVTRAYLKVEAPPTIRLPRQYEDGLIFEKGETVRLKVSVVGQPVPSIMWFLNGIEIVPSLKYEIDYIDQTASLKVKNAQRNDRGEYQIQASNVLGEDLASILVTIANRPEPPMNVQVVRILGKSVTLAWSPPNDDGGCEIGCYIIEYYKTNWDVWLKAMTSRQLQVMLDDLIEGSQYKFRVKAENPYGISDPSTETDIIFIPDPKRGIFEPYQAIYDDSLIPDSVLELEVPQASQYQNRSTPTRDRLGIDSISNISRYSGDSQTETDGSSENLDRKKFSPVKPVRKHRKKAKMEQPTINIDLLNLPDDDYVHHQRNFSDRLSVDRRLSPSPQPSISVDDTSRTSSELMLVLVPSEEDLRNSRARSLTYDLEPTNQLRTSRIPPPPISLSAPELGSEMQFFKPLQRNCVSSTEILHESTIARFYKELQEEDAAAKFNEKFNLPKKQSLIDNFPETSQLLLNRQQKTPIKMSAKDLKSDVVTDLRKIDDIIDDPLIVEDHHENELEMFSYKPPDYNSTPQDRFDKTNSLSRSRVQRQLAPNTDRRSLSPSRLSSAQTIPSTRSILSVEPHPQGRYSPQSGTFHYPDLFMESLTKSPKFKSTSGSLSELVAELIAKKAASINSYPISQLPPVLPPKPSEEVPSCSKDGWIPNRSPILEDYRKSEVADWEENEDSDKRESEEFEESEDDSDEFEDNEADTYHPSDCAPLSFEQALAISNPKRSVSPTNDLFLESETPFYEDDGEPDYGLHYFNRNYGENHPNQVSRPASFSIRGEEKLLKPILKVSSYEEPNTNSRPGQGDPPDPARVTVQRRDSRSPKKHVRIEEPSREFEPQKKTEDTSLVIINHYSDIVKQYGNVQKPPVKRYMTYEELKAAAQMAEREMENFEGDVGELDDEELDDVFLDDQPAKCQTEFQTIHSPEPGPVVKTEVDTEKVKQRVHFFFDFCLDFFMFTFACWVYCFKDERLAIPIIVLMVYRQLYDKIKNKLPRFNFWRKPKVS